MGGALGVLAPSPATAPGPAVGAPTAGADLQQASRALSIFASLARVYLFPTVGGPMIHHPAALLFSIAVLLFVYLLLELIEQYRSAK